MIINDIIVFIYWQIKRRGPPLRAVRAFLIIIYSFFNVHSRTRAFALFRPASHGRSFVNGTGKVNVCSADAYFSYVHIILGKKIFITPIPES